VDAAAGKADAVVADALGRDLAGPQLAVCHGRRTNLTEDPMNCGACGVVCQVACSEGACADGCQAPLVSAGSGVCVDPRSDVRNCGGGSGLSSVCTANQICSSGKCTDVCKSGELLCGGACVLPASDNKNCGACGNVCPTGTGCISGACLPCTTLLPMMPLVNATQEPSGVLTADLNGDGKLDLVTWGSGIGTFLGNGDGTFASERKFPEAYFRTPVAVDLDRDGKIDLVASSEKHDTLVVWPGLGDGAFGPERSFPVPATGKPVVADLNGDGKLDVAVMGTDNSVKVMLATSGAELSPAQSTALEISGSWIAAGDFDGDGNLDLVVAGVDSSRFYAVYALAGVGDGTFKTPQRLLNKDSVSDLAAGDLDNDGKAEIILLSSGQVLVVRQSLDGSYYQPRSGISVAGSQGPLLLADVNGDDRLDVVVGDSTEFQVLLSSNYGHDLGAARKVTVGKMDGMALGDLNGDGRLDAVISNRSAKTLSILPGLGQGAFLGPAPQGRSVVLDGMLITDLDQDGQLDILGHKYGYKLISIFRGKYAWDMEEMWDVPAEAGAVFGVADLNGDAKGDIVIGSEKADNFIFLMSGADGYTRTTSSLGSTMNALVLGDWDGDGKVDFAAINKSASDVTVVLGKGGTSLGTPTHYPVPAEPGQIFAVDLDGDTKKDLLVAGNGSVSVFSNKGDGTFAAAKKIGTAGAWVEVGDFDENGIVDLAVLGYRDSATSNSGVGVLLGTGGGAFAAAKTYPYVGYVNTISVGDMDGDGHLDLMIPSSTDNTVSFRLGRGDGSFGPVVATYPLSRNARLFDIDHDGQSEMILSDNNGFGIVQGIKACAVSR
jgi:hypothetical protein